MTDPVDMVRPKLLWAAAQECVRENRPFDFADAFEVIFVGVDEDQSMIDLGQSLNLTEKLQEDAIMPFYTWVQRKNKDWADEPEMTEETMVRYKAIEECLRLSLRCLDRATTGILIPGLADKIKARLNAQLEQQYSAEQYRIKRAACAELVKDVKEIYEKGTWR